MNPQIAEYIRVQREAGTPDETITKNLRASGWPQNLIDQAMQTPATAQPTPPNSGRLRGPIQLLTDSFALIQSKLTIIGSLLLISILPSILIAIMLLLMENGALSMGSEIYGVFMVIGIANAVLGILNSICSIGIIHVLANRNSSITVSEAFSVGLRKLIPFAWIVFLTSFMVMGGFLFFVIPGLLFALWFGLGTYVYLVEGTSGLSALLKSHEYVRGHTVAFVGRILFLMCMAIVLALAVLFTSAFMGSELMRQILFTILSLVLTPIILAYFLFIYEDLRSIKGSVDHLITPAKRQKYLIIAGIGFILIPIIIAAVFFLQIQPRSRDSQRVSDIYTTGLLIRRYELQYHTYPPTLEAIPSTPQDPMPTDPLTHMLYHYEQLDGGNRYRLCADYETDNFEMMYEDRCIEEVRGTENDPSL